MVLYTAIHLYTVIHIHVHTYTLDVAHTVNNTMTDRDRIRQELIELYTQLVSAQLVRGRRADHARSHAAGVFIGILVNLACNDSRNWQAVRRTLADLQRKKR